ncbi:MAG: hypothetical protein UY35_C0002G0050 [Candidatus Saccharibacteria bacterium GW2011_GWC2_48_9]|nr:MAG: hypothetical protein UY35_C0002G0050 [Candidatus Saccharibacteria bacterium GW2011_GWC2_48_9]
MPKPHIAAIGKVVRHVTRLRGGGSAFPGLVIEKIDPDFTRETLASLPYGVVIISGTNGKTTTTKMTVELLESQGFKVFTNRTGSNFARGVTAALLADIDYRGNLDADVAVLELDEAHAVKFVDSVPPKYSLLLNVMRDQLDRFGEIDTTAGMLAHIAAATTGTVVLNREDPRIAPIADNLPEATKSEFFGLSETLRAKFPSDDDLHRAVNSTNVRDADVILQRIDNNTAVFHMDNREETVQLKLKGVYNIYNAAAALALTRTVAAERYNKKALLDALSDVRPAFGRGETLTLDGQPVELVLVKNPSGFRLALESFSPDGFATMIAINDNYADGRDMSWLWDVDFESLRPLGVAQVSGVRAYDMALRLQYDEVEVADVTTDVEKALAHLRSKYPSQPKRIFCTYTAMLKLRASLGKITEVERIL